MLAALIPAIGGVLGKVIDRVVPDPEAAAKAKLEAMSILHTERMAELEGAAEIIVAEAKSEGILARNWRPITMLTFVAIIANNYIFAPLFDLPALPIPPDMWDLLKIGIGGYIVGRSGEKVARQVIPKLKPKK